MDKQKLVSKFGSGFFFGALFCFLFCTVLVEAFFVSKEVFNNSSIYVNGKIYKLCKMR